MRPVAAQQQRQCRLDAVGRGDQVAAHHPFDQGGIEAARLDVLASPGVEDGLVERAPLHADDLGHARHRSGVGQVAGQHQRLQRIALGQCLQRLRAPRTQRDPVPGGQQARSHCLADATAGAGQPDAPGRAHASLRRSQRMAPPISGTCW